MTTILSLEFDLMNPEELAIYHKIMTTAMENLKQSKIWIKER